MCYLVHPLRSLLARFGLATVFSLVSVADKSKTDYLNFDVTCDVLRTFLNPFETTRRELSITASPASLRPLLRD